MAEYAWRGWDFQRNIIAQFYKNFIYIYTFLKKLDICAYKELLKDRTMPLNYRNSNFTRTSFWWELTCDGLVYHPEGVKDSHPFNTRETGDKRRHHGPLGS